MKIRLAPDQEAHLAALAARAGRSAAELVQIALAEWEERQAEREAPARPQHSPAEAAARTRELRKGNMLPAGATIKGPHQLRTGVTFVLDNSVAMRWCFENTAHPYADGVLNRLAAGEDALVPVLWFYEASAVPAREQNRGTLAAPKADQFIVELRASRHSLPLATLDDELIRASKAAGVTVL